MAELELSVIPVVDRDDPTRLDGLIAQFDLLRVRQKMLIEECHAERILTPRSVNRRTS
jgi:hypothetical protein